MATVNTVMTDNKAAYSGAVKSSGARTALPGGDATFDEKITPAYGLKVAEFISRDWMDGSGRITKGCSLYDRREYVRRKRLFVRGEYDVAHFKEGYAPREGALELTNLDFTPINWAEKFCRIVSNGISDKNYKLDVRAVNRLAKLNKEAKRDRYLKYMLGKRMMDKMKKVNGVDITPKGFIPENEEDINIQLEIRERDQIEIAEELLIDYVLNTSGWDFLSGQYDKDLVDVGMIIGRVYLDKNDGIKFEYVDPENYVHSRVTRNDFADKFYEGEVKTKTISEIRRESGLGELELKDIAKRAWPHARAWDNNCTIDDIVDILVPVLHFAFKTSKTIVYKKKTRKGETVKVAARPEFYDGPRTSATFDTWIEGYHVVGTQYLYNYHECENLYSDQMNKAMSPYITIAHNIYENRLRSFSDNIEPMARLLQKAHLKVQQLINELKPDGIAIDINQLAELDDGTSGGNMQAWQKALNLWETKGVAFVKTINQGDDGIKTGAAISPLAYQQGTALAPLLNSWAHYYNQMRETTGINPARDGSMPADALVGVTRLAEMSSNTVTKDIVDCAVMFKKRISEVISTRLHAIFSYKDAEHLREMYVNVVGKKFVDAVEIMKDRHLHEFGFTFEMYPTQQELQEFREDLGLAIQEGAIDPQIKAEAMMYARTNIKLAIQYVMYHRRENLKKKQEQDMMLAEHKSNNDIRSAQASEQAKLQSYGAKLQMDYEFAKKIAEVDVLKEQALLQVKEPSEVREFQESVYLAKIKAAGDIDIKKYLEDRKDDRTDKQATQQSKILAQRNSDGAPIDFNNENSWFQTTL